MAEDEMFRCPYCGLACESAAKVREHLEEKHAGQPLRVTVRVGQVKWD